LPRSARPPCWAACAPWNAAAASLGLLGIAFVSGTIGYPGAIAVMSLWVLGGAALFVLSELADRARR